MAGIFRVKEAVWLAAALKAYIAFKDGKKDIKDYCLSASDLQKAAQFYAESEVQNARIYQHYNGDHTNPTGRYLRRLRIDENLCYRVTATGEFGGSKEHPDSFYSGKYRDITVKTESGVAVSLKELKDFLADEYISIINKTDEWQPTLEEYDPGLSVDDWFEILNDKEVMSQEKLSMLAKMLKMGGAATCTKLAETFGGSHITYKNIGQDIGRLIHNKYDIPFYKDDKGESMFVIPFVGKYINEDSNRRYAWKIREPLKKALSMIDLGKDTTMNQNENYDLNMILYGPPGTGKTYNSATYAVAICDGKDIEKLTDYEEVIERYNELKRAGRIAFTTFHQSYGYEEFIEGIKPVMGENNDIGYTIESGVFKKFCDKARLVSVADDSSQIIKENPRIWGMLLDGTGKSEIKKNCYANNVVRLGFTEVSDESIESEYNSNEKGKMMVNYFKNEVEVGDLVVVVGNTSKSIDGIGIITGDYVFDDSERDYKRKRDVKWLLKDSDQDMVEYLNAKGRKKFGRNSIFDFDYIGLDTISEILEQNGVENRLTVSKENKPYVFIIDEINRGNISKIFGELITLIENTKREGMPEAASAILPYSHEEFSVPSNVYILGTMNTADRSIALMDTALRRRFSFKEMMPKSDVLVSIGADKVVDGNTELNVAKMLDIINRRIEYLYDREHTIGHAFFTGLKDNPTIENLAGIFEKSVIPLLQEYFYEDYSKIQLVLGDNAKVGDNKQYQFIRDDEMIVNEVFAGVPDIEPETRYTIQKDAFTKIESYKLIGKGL